MLEEEPILLTGSANEELAKKVGDYLGLEVYQAISRFEDMEARVDIPVNVENREVFIIQPTNPPLVDNHYTEILGILDAAKRFKAKKITTIIPYFGYSRSDHTDGRQTAVMAEVWAKSLEHFGTDKIITFDLHNELTRKSVKIPWEDLSARSVLIEAVKERGLDLLIFSPDEGGVDRARRFSQDLGLSEPLHLKKRRDPNVPDEIKLLEFVEGDVRGKDILIVDDMLSTGGTLIKATNLLMAAGARSARAAITHGIWAGNALEKISELTLEEIIITDSIKPKEEVATNPKVKIVSIAPVIAEAIKRSL